MKHLPLLAGLFGCLPFCAWAVELAPTTVTGDASADPGLTLDQSSGMASRLRAERPGNSASVAIAKRNDIERHGAETLPRCGRTPCPASMPVHRRGLAGLSLIVDLPAARSPRCSTASTCHRPGTPGGCLDL